VVRQPVNPPADGWSLTLPPRLAQRLTEHLFPGARDEHGAVILAERATGPRGPRLLARDLILAVDGEDYVAGTTGYRALTAQFVRDAALRARDEQLAYLAVHNHRGADTVGFSSVDLASHERGYPALRRITNQIVGAVVFAQQAAAGDLWLPDGTRADLAEVVIPGNNLARLQPRQASAPASDPEWDRQARLFGDRGQETLKRLRVGVVGLGGVGSLIVELLARSGVGELALIDPDPVDVTNLPRLVAGEPDDVNEPKLKTELAARNARRANPRIVLELIPSRVEAPQAREALTRCDWIFLAADTDAARHWVNATIHEHLIPATQAGVKVHVLADGDIGQIHMVSRILQPGEGCLWCNELIDATRLAIDMHPDSEREQAQYVPGVPAPSVMALNSVAASEAVTHFMLAITSLHEEPIEAFDIRHRPRKQERDLVRPRQDPTCTWCSPAGSRRLRTGSQ
jgi:hypothetical protein